MLPPGYVDALSYNLAIRIAPEYEVTPSPTVAALAIETKANIKRLNSTPPQNSISDAMYLGGSPMDGEFNSFGRYPVP